MFPNPQDALPLPPHPSIEQYRKLAKDLVKACKSGESDAIGTWAERWLTSLVHALGVDIIPRVEARIGRQAVAVQEFAVKKLTGGDAGCVLADAQYVIARSHGFDSWPKFAAHLDALTHSSTGTPAYEAAVDAIVSGDEAALRELLRADPDLIRARSTREHNSTLLHYSSANGVEGDRQKTPKNAVAILKILLDAGAEVDAEADVYGGGSTTLGLVATSGHPRVAGVQLEMMQLLLDRGARIEGPPIAGNDHGAVMACLANGCPAAAVYLAERGARLGLEDAAGVGRLDVVATFFDETGRPKSGIAPDLVNAALRYATGYGRIDVAEFLIKHGADLADGGDDGQTALHYAVIFGHLDMVKALLKHNPPLEAVNIYGGTVLGQTLWSAAHGGDPDNFIQIIETLLAAGAKLKPEHPRGHDKVDAFLASRGSVVNDEWYWYGEKPLRQKRK